MNTVQPSRREASRSCLPPPHTGPFMVATAGGFTYLYLDSSTCLGAASEVKQLLICELQSICIQVLSNTEKHILQGEKVFLISDYKIDLISV